MTYNYNVLFLNLDVPRDENPKLLKKKNVFDFHSLITFFHDLLSFANSEYSLTWRVRRCLALWYLYV